MPNFNNNNKRNLVELEASLAPAKAEFGAVAKGDKYTTLDESNIQFLFP